MTPETHELTNRDDTIDVIALWRILWGRKYLIAVVAAAFGLGAVVLAVTATEIYRAETVVTPVSRAGMGNTVSSFAGQLGGLAGLAGINLGSTGGAGQEAQAVLNSRRLIEEFIRRNDLEAQLLPAGDLPPTLWRTVRQFRESVVSIATDDIEGTTTIAVEWTDPEVAARWANGLAELANELLRSKAMADSNRNIEYLNKQIEKTNVLEIQRVMYNLIENETKTLMLANVSAEYAFTIVDPAVVPEVRVRPVRTLMVLTGGAIGLILGVMLAFGINTVQRYEAREKAMGAGSNR